MSAASSKSSRVSSRATPSATSSPASGSGATPCAPQAGPMTDLFGQALAPASPSAPPAKAMSSAMSATYGRSGSGSSASAALSLSLASRLQARTLLLGSTMFQLTWKARVTPSGRSIPALRASGRPTSASAFTSWPTPATADTGVSETARQGGENLSVIASWATPRAEDSESSGMRHSRGVADTLTAQSSMVGWATPKSSDAKCDPYEPTETRRTELRKQVSQVMPWATPAARDSKGANSELHVTTTGGGQEAHGPASESGGSPGPTNGRWADAEWLHCRDGKARPTQPGTFPLAHGATARVGRLRAYGNAINAAQAEEFIRAYQGVTNG